MTSVVYAPTTEFQMSRTVRRKNSYSLHYYAFTSYAYTYHRKELALPDAFWWFHCRRYGSSTDAEMVAKRSKAWYQRDKRKGRWCGRCLFKREHEREFKRKFNHKVRQVTKLSDYEDADYLVPNKARYIHPYRYS